MRSYEERKAEVFRRSENRIKAHRRRRSCILALCIPLCLGVTMWSAGHVSERGVEKSFEEEKNTGIDKESVESMRNDVILIDVEDTARKTHLMITDVSAICAVHDKITDILRSYEFMNGGMESSIESNASGYVITVVTEDGEKNTFTLVEDMFYVTKQNIVIWLSDEQANDLQLVLGITNRKE